MFQFVWNCLLMMLFLGALKAALSLRWPTIGEWRYDDLHPSLRYHDSPRVTQLAVNLVFFLVYPVVLLWRWYHSSEWTAWTDVEKDLFEQHIDLGEDELLRCGSLRGRMIIQKEIVVCPTAATDESEPFERYERADEEFVEPGTIYSNSGAELNDEELPLNLSKGNEMYFHAEYEDHKRKESYEPTENEEEDVENDVHNEGDEVPLIVPSSETQHYTTHSSAEVTIEKR
ncbi:uncharacterized protein LOC131289767 [Anopheles ziemanni]|uniref:uncharacterized protein LOC131260646 n=1 Tax=Anopheles coustani TaxID=139045 RepID=UPI002659EB1D|nr:uncharacterized protein LOC131260646 [Anopheles coustani]XP_058175060.1 uncharacterized protein LOC131289767 [Anopheles ziemanni]